MSKAKKIISMLLVVAMVLSIAPASVLAYAASPTATFTEPDTDLVTFATDTSETTEVIRVAGGEGIFTLGTTIVAATPSGIPRADSGQFIDIAYAGETPEFPKISFKITGVKPDKQPTIVSTLGSSATIVAETTGTQDSSGAYEYTWRITGGTATTGDTATFTITYYVNGTEYKAYAYSFVEDILIMNGYVMHKYQNGGDHTPDPRHSNIVQFGGKNVYSGWYNDLGVVNKRAFVNYAAGNAMTGGALAGAGEEGKDENGYYAGTMDGYVVDALVSATGTPKGVLIKSTDIQNKDDWSNVCFALDGNRAESTIYIDKRNETLGSLNVRLSLQAGDTGNTTDVDAGAWPYTVIRGVDVLNGPVSFGANDTWATVTAKSDSLINDVYEITANIDTTNITTIEPPNSHRYVTFDGAGPALQNGTTSYQNTLLLYTYEHATNSNGTTENQEIGAIGVVFNVYNTIDLYNVFYGIMKGANINDGSDSYTCTDYIKYVANSGEAAVTSENLSVTFNKGAHPQSSYYEDGWDTFLTAYQTAGRTLAQPNTDQTKINQATKDLIEAYNGLTGFNPTVTYTIKHCIAGTSTEIVNASTDGYTDAKQTGTEPAGTHIKAYAATITGYSVDGDSIKELDLTGENATETITFYYKPNSYNVNAVTNNETWYVENADGTVTDKQIQIHPVSYGTKFQTSTATNGANYDTNNDGVNDIENPGVGSKPYWEFKGWYYADKAEDGTWDETQKVPAEFEMSNNNVTIYARWDTAPVHIYATPMLDDGTVLGDDIDLGYVQPSEKADETKPFERPNDSIMELEGYLFVGYYEKYDGGFQNAFTWPVDIKLGDSDRTIVARYADVNGKIVFEPNGGDAVPDLAFTANVAIAKSDFPTPTRVGYDFVQWHKNSTLTEPVFADGVESITLTDNTGFIAYAEWTPKLVGIEFDTAMGANPSKYDTTSMTPIFGYAGTEIKADEIPANPRRFGYEFAGWLLDGKPYTFSKWPVVDGTITLVATWRASDESAFIELTAIEKVLGTENTLANNDKVQRGDIITVRMTSTTNFYVGSSLFIFMYDANFYELVGTGKDAFTLNTENDYISGINARYTAVTTSSSLPWPDGTAEKYSSEGRNMQAMQIAIDPTVSTTDYNCEPMADGTWMVEFKLKVKDDAIGEGLICMDNDWTRNPDNIMGTMFYGWASSGDKSVIDTENNRVTPDLVDASKVLVIDETEVVETTVTLNVNGGAWTDSTTADKSFTGSAGKEILDYVAPEKVGYSLNKWYAVQDDETSASWIEGYYPPEDTLTAYYYANWTANEYPVVFHWDEGSDEIYTEISVAYETDIAADAVANPTRTGYVFAGWVDADGNLVTLPQKMTTASDDGYHLFATWNPATDTKFSIKVYYPNSSYDPTVEGSSQYVAVTQVQDASKNAYQGTTGQTVALVTADADQSDPNTLYICVDDLAAVVGGNYVFDPDNNTTPVIDTDTIAADGSTVLEVYYIGKLVTLTFNANGGTFPGGETTLVKEGRFLSAFSGLADDELPTKYGYELNSTSPWGTTLPTAFNATRSFNANWVAKDVHVRFMVGDEQYGDLVATKFNSAPAAPTEPTKDGWTFVGWNTDSTATTGVKTLPAVTAEDSADGYAVTYYAIFTKTPYTVTYSVTNPVSGQSTQIGETETYYMDDVVTVWGTDVEGVALKGYDFNGWTIDGTAAGATFVMGTKNVEIVGTYTAKKVNVKYYPGVGAFADGAEYIEVESTFNEAITVPAESQYPTKDGYTFVGWNADSAATTGSKTDLGTLTEESATFYAIFTPNLVTYYIDIYEMGLDGEYTEAPTRTETGTGYVDDEATITSTDDVEGFTLVTAATQTETIPATGELRFTVKYERNKYDLTYVIDEAETTVEYYYGATIDGTKAPDTTKEGYTFQNWNPSVPATMPAEDVTVTAVYTINQYYVKFYADQNKLDTELVYNQQHDFKSEIPVVGTQYRDGYNFLGWAYDGTTTVIDLTNNKQYVPASDVTFVGIWEAAEFTLNYRGASGVHETYQVKYGTPVAEWPVPDTDPTRTGYYFNGWSDSGYTTMPNVTVNIQPVWVLETYKFQFAETGDTVMNEITVTYGETIDAIGDPVKEGNVFTGWKDADGADTSIPTEIEDLGDNGAVIVFTGTWRPETYTLKFANTGDTTIADKPVTYGETIAATPDPEKVGHVFAGWDVTPPTKIGDLGEDGAVITYTASWTKETYTLKFADTGDTVIEDKVVTYGDTIAATADPVKAGYVFAGWDVTPPTTIGDLGENGAVITYTASWTIDQFTVTFDSDEGTAVKPITQDYDSEVKAPTAPTKEGHVFSHWINIKDNSTVTFPFDMPAENLNLKAIWTKETYTLKFADTDDAGTVITKEVTYGDTIEIPSGLTKTGYIFTSWDTTPPTLIGDLGEDKAVITYTAQWTEKTYTLKFTDTGDTTIADMNVKFGDTITVPTGLTKDGQGYYFTETWKDENGNVVTPPTTITDMGDNGKEFTYVAQWAKESYTIAFDSNEGSAVASINASYGDAVTAPKNPTKEGHEFVQWNDKDGNKYTIQPIMPDLGDNNATITLTAQWNILSYTVTFYDALGDVYDSAEVVYGKAIADYIPADLPEKEHYTTLGWSTVQNDTVAITDFGTMPASAVNYYPVFERIAVTLKLLEGSTAEVFEVDDSDPSLKIGYIRGLETQLTKATLESKYVGVTGDGELRITPSFGKFNICGTGTVIEVYDNVEQVVVERYYIVIYGDVNGDSGISATDVSAILRETNGLTSWSIEGESDYNYAYVLAADIKKDESIVEINGLDAAGLRDVSLSVAKIDQATGTVSYYA